MMIEQNGLFGLGLRGDACTGFISQALPHREVFREFCFQRCRADL